MSDEIKVDVRALAQLARMEVADAELEKLEKELPAILSFVETIQKAGISKIERKPLLCNVMREDTEPHESGIYTEKILAQAPAQKDGRLVVKQVISRKFVGGGSPPERTSVRAGAFGGK